MILDRDKVVEVLTTTKEIIEELKAYTINGHSPAISIEDLHSVVERMTKITIEKREVIKKPGPVRGGLKRYTDRAVIAIDSSLSDVFKRFTAAKELCQIAIDKKGDWSTDAHETIEALLTTFRLDTNGDHEPEQHIVLSEILGEISALEVLYPAEFREGDQAKISEKTITYAFLEAHYKIPRFYIERALNDSYKGISALAIAVFAGEVL